jgi:hypothetical protein
MSEQRPSVNRVLLAFASQFGKVIGLIKPPFMKLLAFLAVILLLAFLFVRSTVNPALGLVLVGLVLLIFACLAGGVHYLEVQLRYRTRTEEALKKALRDSVTERLEAKAGQAPLPAIRITYLEYDPPGKDVQGEVVRIENFGRTRVDLTDWILRDDVDHRFEFPEFALEPGAYVRVWTEPGLNTRTDLYWGRHSAVWNNAGDCVYLIDDAGALVHTYRYG